MSAARSTHKARNVELAKIHIAKQQLGLDEDTYRSMLWTLARVRSAKDLDEHGRRAVLEHLKSRGFKDRGAKRKGRPHNADHRPQIRKIEALLAAAGRPWAYADSMAKRMFEVDRVTFCRADQLRRLIAALSYDAQRRAQRPQDAQPVDSPVLAGKGATPLEPDADQS